MKHEREYRDLYEVLKINEEDQEKIVEGYASTFNQPYVLWTDEAENLRVQEQVDSSAFAETDMSDVIMQYDHRGRVFARNKNNTLSIIPDEKGLYIRANLGGTEIGRQLYEEIRGGYTDKMSFGFTVTADEWNQENVDGIDVYTRTIKAIGKLYDVSAVSIPANDNTSISVRSLVDGEIQKIKAERLAVQKRREVIEALKNKVQELKGE